VAEQNSVASARYLTIVKDELGSRLKPALEAGQLQQIAMCGQFILSNLVTRTNALPALRVVAMDEIAELIASLKPVLNQGDGQQRLAALEASLQGARDFQQVEAALQQVSKSLTEKQGDAMATKLNKQIVGVETRLHSGFLKAYQEEIARSSVSTDSKDVLSVQQVAQLTQWMRERFPGNETLEISGLKAIPGGFSKHTIFVFLKNAKTLPGTVVVRLDWSASVVGTTVANEFRIIETLFKAGVKVPQPYALEASGKVLGGPFLLLSKAEGSNPGDSFDVPNGSKAFAQDLARTLAKMHTVPVESFGDAVAGAKETTRAPAARNCRIRSDLAFNESAFRLDGDCLRLAEAKHHAG
jgi:Phosphotransferase enzyme family